jgi:predicted CoA-substrate-specific enzyme activase
MIFAGIDAGSRTIKVVLIDGASGKCVGSGITDQGVEQDRLACELFEAVLEKHDINRKDVRGVVATGYGRDIVRMADTTITEISCQAAGVLHHIDKAKTVIDIGGQDSKVVRLNSDGKVRDFAMNDRCAAGTGRFLEIVAERLGVELSGLGELVEGSKEPCAISSMCVVFAETEIVGLLAGGCRREDIAAGVQESIAKRVSSLVGRKRSGPIVFTGGVAMIEGMDRALESVLGAEVEVCPEPQMTGALGAALLATERFNGSKDKRKLK